jgi:hypothetical protein
MGTMEGRIDVARWPRTTARSVNFFTRVNSVVVESK